MAITFGGLTTEQIKAASTTTFTPIPEGWYNVFAYEVKPAKFKSEKYKGRDHLSVTLKVADGKYTGRRIFNVLVPLFERWDPTEKSPEGFPTNFVPFLTAAGIDLTKEQSFQSVDALANALVGTKMQVRVAHEPDEYAYNKAAENGELDGRDESDFVRETVRAFKAPGTIKIQDTGAASTAATVIDL